MPVMEGDMTSLVAGRYHYIKNGDGSEELYDFESDPEEKGDLGDSEKGRELLARFRDLLGMRVAKSPAVH